jgi:hypothetical protein
LLCMRPLVAEYRLKLRGENSSAQRAVGQLFAGFKNGATLTFRHVRVSFPT